MLKKLSSLSLILIILGFSIAFSSGCGYKEEKIEARAFVNSYFKSIKNQEYSYLLSYYSKEAFGVVSPDKALRGMRKAQNSFGQLRSFKLKQNSIIIFKNKSGDLSAKLTYSVVYRKIKTKESFTISRVAGKNKWLIITHTIDRIGKDIVPRPF